MCYALFGLCQHIKALSAKISVDDQTVISGLVGSQAIPYRAAWPPLHRPLLRLIDFIWQKDLREVVARIGSSTHAMRGGAVGPPIGQLRTLFFLGGSSRPAARCLWPSPLMTRRSFS
jgi:hypothetical protein